MNQFLVLSALPILVLSSCSAPHEGTRSEERPHLGALIKQLSDPDPNVRELTARTLSKMGSKAQPAVPALLKQVDDADPNVRGAVLAALVKIDLQSPKVIQVVRDGLRDKERNVRLDTLWPLEELGRRATPLLSDLLQSLKDPRPGSRDDIRHHVAEAIMAIDPGNPQVVPVLIQMLDEKDPVIRGPGCRHSQALVQMVEPCCRCAGKTAFRPRR